MISTELDVFDPYQKVSLEFLDGLDMLTAEPVAVPVVALLSGYREGLSLGQTQAWLNEATGRSEADAYPPDKVRALGVQLDEGGMADMRPIGIGQLSAMLTLKPETEDLYSSIAVAISSWQIENREIPWVNMLAKSIMIKHAAAHASSAFGLLHHMSANKECTGGDKVADWSTYDLAMTRLVKAGVAECTQLDEGINSYRLAGPYKKPAEDLVGALHQAATYGLETPRFELFAFNEFSNEWLSDGMKWVIQHSVRKATIK